MVPTDGKFSSRDVIQWALRQTCDNFENFQPLWAWNGIHYYRRAPLWNSLLLGGEMSRDIVYLMQEPEAKTMLQLYAPWETPNCLPELDYTSWHDRDLQDLIKIWRNSIKYGTGDCRVHEEQERQIAVEVPREQQVCRPRDVNARKHIVSDDIRYFVGHGTFRNGRSSSAAHKAFQSLRRTSAGQFSLHSTLSHNLYVTLDFMETVDQTVDILNDEFQKSVHWILSNVHDTKLLILSQFEVNELYCEIKRSKEMSLHIYIPRTTKGMRSF